MDSTSSFLFYSNRAVAQFSAALVPMSGRVFDTERDDPGQLDFLYFDTYGGKQAPAVSDSCLDLIPRQRTMALDNKEAMARALLVAGHTFPRVFFSAADVPQEPASLWYVKSPLSSAGRGIRVMSQKEIMQEQPANVVIQEAVQDLSLIEGRKYTLRMYVLVSRGRVSLYSDGFVIVHAAPYQPDSRDPAVQFAHAGYMQEDSGVRLRVLSELAGSADILASARNSIAQVFGVFSDRLKYEKAQHYCLFGVDLLVRADGSTVLIEINDRPNLVHTDAVNQRVNVPMLQAMIDTLNPPWLRTLPQPVGENRQFELLTEL